MNKMWRIGKNKVLFCLFWFGFVLLFVCLFSIFSLVSKENKAESTLLGG